MSLDRSFYQELEPYRIQRFNGLDQNMSDLEQMASGKTALCDGLSQRGGRLSTNEFGFGCLPFDWAKEGKRVYGIMPSTDKGKFYCTVSEYSGGALASKTFYMNMFTFATTQLDTHDPKYLVSSSILNNRVATADGNSMRKYYQATIYDDLVRKPPAPTFNADSGTGITGTFYYRVTLIDAAGNETGGGTVSAARTVANKTINPTVDITGFTVAAKGYTKIRWYRTATTASAPSDLETLTFYYLGTSFDSTIADPTVNYTIADSTADATLITNDQLNNSQPVNSTFYADIVFQWDNRLFALGTTEGSTYYGSRVRWCLLTDSTGDSLGNITSWRQQDFIDLDPDDGDNCIGGWGGYSGIGFVFKGDSTYRLTPTGSTTAPYRADKINDEYGFFHHTIDDTGNGLIGRTRSAICVFNGSSFRQISDEVSLSMANSIQPFGDTGAYDSGAKRYYYGFLDSRVSYTYNFLYGALQGLAVSYNNSVLAFDFTSGGWESYRMIPAMVFKKLEDSNNNARIFMGGESNDVHVVMKNSFQGVCLTKVTQFSSTTQVKLTLTTANDQLNGRKISIPIFFDSGANKIIFTEANGTVSDTTYTAPTTYIDTSFNLPIITDSLTERYVTMIDASSGTTTTAASSGQLTDSGTNYFSADTLDGFSAMYAADATGETWTGGYSDFTVINSSNISFGLTTPPASRKYAVFPLRTTSNLMVNVNNGNLYNSYKTFLTGMSQSTRRKSFRFLQLMVRGSGLLRIRTFVGGTTTATQTLYQTLSDRDVWVNNAIDLNGAVGDSIAVEIGMIRGVGDFECQEITAWARYQGGLRDA